MSFNYNNINLFGYSVFTDDLNKIDLSQKCIINTINPHSYVVAKSDKEFKNALLSSDILLPDGEGIVYAISKIYKQKINKIAGNDIFLHILSKLQKEKKSCFFLGASQKTLDVIYEKLEEKYPNIKVGSFSPPYKETFLEEDDKIMIDKINVFKPDVLFVGMTAPKQEKWVFKNSNKLNAQIICSIGAVFDFYAGTVKRPSQFWIKLHLEWFVRLIKQPKKLWRRNFISTPVFLKDVFTLKSKL